jgi:ribosomal protein S18 acetylase RimI-like enzyme
MSALTIRPATPSDADGIAHLHVTSWRETYEGMLPKEMLASMDVGSRRSIWTSVLSNASPTSANTALILEGNHQAVGFCAFGDQRSLELEAAGYDGEIGAIYILAAAQGFGGGQLLMNRAASLLSERGKKSVSVWVLSENQKARRFYERLGGRLVGEREERQPQMILAEVAYGWPDLAALMT